MGCRGQDLARLCCIHLTGKGPTTYLRGWAYCPNKARNPAASAHRNLAPSRFNESMRLLTIRKSLHRYALAQNRCNLLLAQDQL